MLLWVKQVKQQRIKVWSYSFFDGYSFEELTRICFVTNGFKLFLISNVFTKNKIFENTIVV